MPKANFKRLFFIFLSLTLTWITGCSGPEEKKAEQLKDAAELRSEGESEAALAILEGLAVEYPNDADILKQIGQIFADLEDRTMAAFFLEQAHNQNPDDIELLYQTYLALEAAEQPASTLLETLAERAPDAMTPELWVRLGQYRADAKQTQPALDAYLKGVNPDKSTPSVETAAAIGGLFVQLDNLPQAERWLTIAADNDSPDALTALFGLLEIKLRQKDWDEAEQIISRLDKQFPGAVNASEWSSARSELKRWREAQNAMQAKLKQAEVKKKAAEAKKAATETKAAETAAGKAQVIEDLEAAEALANTPAVEIKTETTVAITSVDATESTSGKTVRFDPNIAIEAAEPDITFAVTYDQENTSQATAYNVENTRTVEAVEASLSEFIEPSQVNSTVRPIVQPRTIEDLVAEASQAEIDRNYELAISNYWQALGTANNRADIWNLLSRAYLIDGQPKNAETTALEAIRLSPREIAYTLDYLRVAQRSKAPTDFLAELETAYDRFPRSPEITLSLARAYERISNNKAAARTLYTRFIEVAPGHPLRTEAESAIGRLR